MKVTSIEAIPLRAKPSEGAAYWGARTWGDTEVEKKATIQGNEPYKGPEYPPRSRHTYVYSDTIDTLLVRVETDEGVVGWGEAKAPVAPRVAASIIEDLLSPVVLGSRLDEISITWERMYASMRVRGHDSGFLLEALSGVDIALWDAWGRTLNQPVWALLGGRFRRAVPVYASGIPAAKSEGGEWALDQVRTQAEQLLSQGFMAIKVAIGTDPEADVASVDVVQEVLGDDGEVYADAAGAYDFVQALSVGRELERRGVLWFEMPVAPENIRDYERLASALDIPLALDSISNRHRALEFLRAGALQVLQPDVCRAGGITETFRISMLADAFGARATPHVSIGSAIHFAASLQVGVALPNLAIMEHWTGNNPLGTVIAPDLDQPHQGVRESTMRPGLGITIDEAAVRDLEERRA